MKQNKYLVIGLAVLIVTVIGGAAYYYFTQSSNKIVACTEEAKVCPDGSSVGRVGPNCEFAPCPTPNTNGSLQGDYLDYDSLIESSGMESQVNTKQMMVIQSEGEYADLREKLGNSNAQTFPSVDFSKSTVIAVFAGQKPNGGYDARVTDVLKNENNITVYATFSEPGPSCVNAQVITSPYHIISIPKQSVDANIQLQEEVYTRDCSE
jgi:hypothetical protein